MVAAFTLIERHLYEVSISLEARDQKMIQRIQAAGRTLYFRTEPGETQLRPGHLYDRVYFSFKCFCGLINYNRRTNNAVTASHHRASHALLLDMWHFYYHDAGRRHFKRQFRTRRQGSRPDH